MPPLSVPSRLNSEAGVMNEHTLIRRADRQLMGRGMRPRVLAICLLLALPGFAQPASQWVLEKSTLTYHVSHPLHETEGTIFTWFKPRTALSFLSSACVSDCPDRPSGHPKFTAISRSSSRVRPSSTGRFHSSR